MSRQTRLIVILAGMALGGVIALSVVAERYSRGIKKSENGTGQTTQQAARVAAAQVDAFVRVRLALRKTIDAGVFDDVAPGPLALAFGAERNRVLSAARFHDADYRELRGHFRKWTQDPASLTDVWRDAFESRREALAGCELGALESLDR